MHFWPLDPKGLFLYPPAVSRWKFVLRLLVASAEAVSVALTHRVTMWNRRGVACPK